jgi:hypothetical protein
MNSKRARTLTILAILIALIAAGLSLFTIFSGDSQAPQTPASVSQEKPVALPQPLTAQQVAEKLGGTGFTSFDVKSGVGPLFGMTSAGRFYKDGVHYAVNVFTTAQNRDAWIKVAEKMPMFSPKWLISTAVVYQSITDQLEGTAS